MENSNELRMRWEKQVFSYQRNETVGARCDTGRYRGLYYRWSISLQVFHIVRVLTQYEPLPWNNTSSKTYELMDNSSGKKQFNLIYAVYTLKTKNTFIELDC